MGPRDAILIVVAVLVPVVPLAVTAVLAGPEEELATGPPDVPPEAGVVVPLPLNAADEAESEGSADLLAADGMTLGTLERELTVIAEQSESDPDVRAHWQQLVARHGLADTPEAYAEFARVRLAHEALRAGGWAGLRWAVTDQDPSSARIWRVCQEGRAAEVEAECDELSALFAFVARGMGVEHVGLFWPTWNHTVAVWSTPGADGEPVRIVVPTSQLFLDPVAGLGDDTFDPSTQRTIYDYTSRDLQPGALLPQTVVRRILDGAHRHGGASAEELTLRRVRGTWFQR